MIPFRDNIPSRATPIMTTALIATNIAVFIFELNHPQTLRRFIQSYGLTPAHPAAVSMVTSMFLHAGWLHLIGNMWYLWIFGRGVEDRFGHLRFFLFYFCCGIAAGVTQMLMNLSSTAPMIGASGAIAGVLGAYLVSYPFSRIQTFVFIQVIELPAVLVLGTWFLFEFATGAAALNAGPSTAGGGIARWAHVGGFLIGMLGGRSSWLGAKSA
jgi:membrane associated rhomboid family serine protease